MPTEKKFITTEDRRTTVITETKDGPRWDTTVIVFRDWVAGKYRGHTDRCTFLYSSPTPVTAASPYPGQLVGHYEDAVSLA
jgi:hypothetical protein